MPSAVEPTPAEWATLQRLSLADPLYPLSERERELLWTHRQVSFVKKKSDLSLSKIILKACTTIPRALPKVLLAAPLSNGGQAAVIAEVHRLVSEWSAFESPTGMFIL